MNIVAHMHELGRPISPLFYYVRVAFSNGVTDLTAVIEMWFD